MTQFWTVGNRSLNAEQMRAYRDGKFDLDHMNILDDKESELEALRDVEKTVGIDDTPEEVNTLSQEAPTASEDVEVELESGDVIEIDLEPEEGVKSKLERYEELKSIGFNKLKGDQRATYKKLKKDLGL